MGDLFLFVSLLAALVTSSSSYAHDPSRISRALQCFHLRSKDKPHPAAALPPPEYPADLSYRPVEGQGEPEWWFVDGPVMAKFGYEAAFMDIIAKTEKDASYSDFFEKLLQDRRKKHLSTHVLDLFGSGFFIENRRLADSITGLRFGTYQRDRLPADYPEAKVPTEILGDIFNPKTWQALDRSMHERSIPGLDLVTMRPVGGWTELKLQSVSENVRALEYIIKHLLPRLNPTGRFYFEFRCAFSGGTLSEEPALKKLVHEIDVVTPFKLVVTESIGSTELPYPLSLSGALIPK